MVSLLLLTFLIAPAYTVKLNLLNYPTDALMVWVIFVWLAFAVYLISQKQFRNFVIFKESLDRKFWILTELFLLAGIISLFVNGIDRAKLGQFIVLFLQPISMFLMGGFIISQNPKAKQLLLVTCYLLLALSGLYAILQYFTLVGLPPAYWGNSVEPKRALSFFAHPNFYALWSAPLLALLIPDVVQRAKGIGLRAKLPILGWLIGVVGLLFSFSRAGWLGLALAIFVYALAAGDKKIRRTIFATVIVMVIVIVCIPNLRWRFTLPFYGEKSAVSRLSLWDTGVKAIKEAPITGLGLTGFANNWERLNTDPNLDTHNFPHNIFFNFWVETGLLGLISFMGIVYLGIYRGFKNRQDLFKLGVALFLVALLTQGLIDNPYFKNDLAMVFWLVLALL